MTYPRAMNNKEKQGLAYIKEQGWSYEIKWRDDSIQGGSYYANIPSIKETWHLASINHTNKHTT